MKSYKEYVPKNFVRPSALVQIGRLNSRLESLNLLLIDCEIVVSGVVAVDAYHQPAFSDASVQLATIQSAFYTPALKVGERYPRITGIRSRYELDGCEVRVSLEWSEALDSESGSLPLVGEVQTRYTVR